MNFFTYPTIYFITIVVMLFYYKKYRDNLKLKLFLYFLIYSFLTEVVGGYLGRVLQIDNNWIYNTWNIVNHLFYAFFFMAFINNNSKRNFILTLIVCYILFTLVNIFFIRSYFNQVLINNIIIGSIIIVLVIVLFYVELLNSDAILNINRSLVFWISIGVLLSNIVLIPVWVFAETLSFRGVYAYLILGSNVLMSICFITGFIVSKKEFNT